MTVRYCTPPGFVIRSERGDRPSGRVVDVHREARPHRSLDIPGLARSITIPKRQDFAGGCWRRAPIRTGGAWFPAVNAPCIDVRFLVFGIDIGGTDL